MTNLPKFRLILLLTIFSSIICFCSITNVAFAESEYFYPSGDASVWEVAPDLNTGSSYFLSVGRDTALGGPIIWSYIGFNDTQLIPSNAIIESAELRLYRYSSSGSFTMGVKLVHGSWWEEGTFGITWNNKPSAYSSPISTINPTGSSAGYVTVNVTDHVKKWVEEKYPIRGFNLYGSYGVEEGELVSFYSSENASISYQPRLKVAYYVPKPDLYDRGEAYRDFNPNMIKPSDILSINCDIYKSYCQMLCMEH